MVEEIGTNTEGDLIINVGPQHPATHGVLHLVLTLNGETIKKVEPHLGYIHRSIEKMCESLTYRQFIYVTSRMDYLSSHINNHACALTVEKAMQIEVPQRAQYIRVIMDELTRIASHELWWGAMAMDLGAFTPFFHAFRERETITDIMEKTCGARLTMNYMVPGGVMVDLHPDFGKECHLERGAIFVDERLDIHAIEAEGAFIIGFKAILREMECLLNEVVVCIVHLLLQIKNCCFV